MIQYFATTGDILLFGMPVANRPTTTVHPAWLWPFAPLCARGIVAAPRLSQHLSSFAAAISSTTGSRIAEAGKRQTSTVRNYRARRKDERVWRLDHRCFV